MEYPEIDYDSDVSPAVIVICRKYLAAEHADDYGSDVNVPDFDSTRRWSPAIDLFASCPGIALAETAIH